MVVIASAPGKVILFGEHAVVYGEPSLAGAIDRRIYVKVEENYDKKIRIISEDYSESVEFYNLKPEGRFRYVKKAVELVFNKANETRGVNIIIKSQLPPASGLGSSAAVSVATILSLSKLLGITFEKKEIAELGHRVELEVQGAASPTDTLTSTFGGVLFIEPIKKRHTNIACPSLPLVIGYTADPRSTAELVKSVRERRDRHPEIIDNIIAQIGNITRKAKHLLEEKKPESIGELMDINHGLLEALGVSTEKLSRLVYAARNAGAKGAKLTGAGGGGCMIAYTPENEEEVIKAITKERCEAFKAEITKEGVRFEKQI